ncbi:MAG: 3-methyladenine DNA glycosylase [Campylobacterota bacterium]|nr:3-methyladenine DNA glycosylase [Campylobacterota bacterium]
MFIYNSDELYKKLSLQSLLNENTDPTWWPNYGTFEVVIGAILTQNTNWNRVQISLQNLQVNGLLKLETLFTCEDALLMECIRPSGMFVNKAKYLKALAGAIVEDFGNFKSFTCKVDREWLLHVKGIGKETADSILCYACERPIMVVDTYTHRLLRALGYEFESYDDLQEWCMLGMGDDAKLFAHYHGLIVEYVKANSKAKEVITTPLMQLK